jgi:disulfide bond formation protein DsbB
MNAPLVSCAQAMAYIFGLSMAAWNAMLSFAAACGTLWLMRKTV